MTFRHFLKQILQPLPGFAGMFHRREQLREHARTIDSMRTQAVAQTGAIDSLRARVGEQENEVASLRARAEELCTQAERQGGEVASLHTQAETQGNEVASLRRQAEAQGGEIASLCDQLAVMRAEAEAREAERAAQRLQWKDVPNLEKQGLFVVGHARSGTSALMHALNSCPDIFLLGEANLVVEGLKPAFARWYNRMHGQDGKLNTKDTYCPVVPDDNANGVETLHWLSQRFRYVGEKMAFRSESLGYNPWGFFEFHARNFLLSHYVCVVRNPADVLKSNREMFKPPDLSIYADSYLQSLELILAFNDTMPNVYVLFHESIDQHAFDVIGERLGVDLSGAHAANYHPRYQVIERYGTNHEQLPSMETLSLAYRRMREAFSPQTLREQPNHPQWMILAESIRMLRRQLSTETPGRRASATG